MDILREVTQAQGHIDELLNKLFKLEPGEEDKLQEVLPSKQYQQLLYTVDIYNKLQDNDDFSLSGKGLAKYQAESQSLIEYLKDTLRALEQSYQDAKKGNRLFNYKVHILTWRTPTTWPVAAFHSLTLLLAIMICGITITAIYFISDHNNLVIFAALIAALILFSPVPEPISKNDTIPVGTKFKIVCSSFLIWKSLFNLFLPILIGQALIKYNNFWRDDILIILTIALPVIMIIIYIRSQVWLEEAEKVESINNDSQMESENA